MKRNVCLAQIEIKAGKVEENLAKIKRILDENKEADLIVFPELVVQGHLYSTASRAAIEEVLEATPVKMDEDLHAYAEERNCKAIFGEMEELDGKFYNVATYVGKGKIEKYCKTHVHWTETFTPGEELRVFDTALDRLGVLICYDAAFPEAARVLALDGARAIVVIAAVPRSFDVRYMENRMTSMAMSNQVFVLYCNRSGPEFQGNSMLVDPRGNILARAGLEEENLIAGIDLAEVDHWRAEESIYPNRRPELYKSISFRR